MGQIEQVNNVEQKIDRTLSNMWLDAIWMRDQLGEEHELYNAFHKLMGDINHVQCQLSRYAEKKEIPMGYNRDAKQQVQTAKHKPMKR